MNLVTSIILILSFIIVYVILIQVYSVLFRITGMTKEKANFQTISMITGAGFTTSESEIVMDDVLRRRIAKAAMITGYAFSAIIISLMFNVFTSLSTNTQDDALVTVAIAAACFLIVFIFIKIPFVNRFFDRIIESFALSIMRNRSGDNVVTLLDNYGKDAIAEIYIRSLPEFMNGKTLLESGLKDKYSMNLLMLKRKGRIIEVTKDTIIQANDSVVIFGSYQNIKDVFGKHVAKVEEVLDEANKENIIDLMDNYGSDAMAEITINRLPSDLVDKTLIESGIKDKHKLNVLMLTRSGKTTQVTKDTIFKTGDHIVVFGPYHNIKELFLNQEKKSEKEAE